MNNKKINPLWIILGLSAGFFALFLIVTGAIFLSGSSKSGSKTTALVNALGNSKIAVLEINGVIMDSKKVLKKLEKIEDDAEIKAVVLRLNSPGGAVAPSQEIYQAVKALKKPVIASMGSVAASGAYYIACAAKKVYANPGTITGSIGVIMEFANLEKLYDWAKIKRYSIKTGRYKDVGSEYRDMTAEDRALIQGMVDDVLKQFKGAVVEGRKLKPEQVDQVADGRIFSGAQAKTVKLVDELGTLNDAILGAAEMAKIKGKPEVVYPFERSKRKWIEWLMDEGAKDEGENSSSGLREVSGALGLVKVLGRLFGPASSLPGEPEEAVLGLSPGVYWLWPGAR